MRSTSLSLSLLGVLTLSLTTVSHAAPAISEKSAPAARIQALTQANERAVKQFLVSLLDRSKEDEFFGVGPHRVVDLDGDGVPELLVALDDSGRAFYNTLRIVWADGAGFRVQDLGSWNLASLAETVADLDGDGKMELILPQELTPYLGSRPMATWRAVYRLDKNRRYKARSESFGTFYESRELPRIAKDIEQTRTNADRLSERRVSDRILVLEIERDKLHRVLGDDPEAGLPSALEWATSSDPTRRLLAVGVLSDIRLPQAQQALKVLARDAHRDVGILAERALAARTGDPR